MGKRKQPTSDGGDVWPVRAIVNERNRGRGRKFEVEWEGLDASGKPWPNSWVAAGDVSQDLKDQWQEKQRTSHSAVSSVKILTYIHQ